MIPVRALSADAHLEGESEGGAAPDRGCPCHASGTGLAQSLVEGHGAPSGPGTPCDLWAMPN
jgi:hypothetical protein